MSSEIREPAKETMEHKESGNWKESMYNVIFKADTVAGKTFDIALIVIIALSVLTVIVNTVDTIEQKYGNLLFISEWVFTIIFTIEYILRYGNLICIKNLLFSIKII